MTSCSLLISRLKKATGTPASMAAYWAMLRTKEVFPMPGRPAMITRSEGWRPAVS